MKIQMGLLVVYMQATAHGRELLEKEDNQWKIQLSRDMETVSTKGNPTTNVAIEVISSPHLLGFPSNHGVLRGSPPQS